MLVIGKNETASSVVVTGRIGTLKKSITVSAAGTSVPEWPRDIDRDGAKNEDDPEPENPEVKESGE